MGPNRVLSQSDWGGPALKNRSGVPIGAILSALAPRQARVMHAPCSHIWEKVASVHYRVQGQQIMSGMTSARRVAHEQLSAFRLVR